MADTGSTDIAVMWTVSEDHVAEGDQQRGVALLGMALHPVDVAGEDEPTGRTIFTLNEVYASPAGVAEHWRLAIESWGDLQAFLDWGKTGEVRTLHSGTVVQALW
jgi:hypothetical protein